MYLCICIHKNMCLFTKMIIQEKEAMNLSVGGDMGGIQGRVFERGWREERAGSDVILF